MVAEAHHRSARSAQEYTNLISFVSSFDVIKIARHFGIESPVCWAFTSRNVERAASMARCSARSAAVMMMLSASSVVWGAAGKAFTVADEIELSHFGDPYYLEAEAVEFSPNGDYFAVDTERGRLDLNRPEDTLRIYRSRDARDFLHRIKDAMPPAPMWEINLSTDRDGHIIMHWRWLADSSGVAFLERGANGNNRLVLADLRTRTVQPMTPENQAVRAFDIRDVDHYAYVLASAAPSEQAAAEAKASAIVGTGRYFLDLLFPLDQYPIKANSYDRGELWAVIAGKRVQIKNHDTGEPLVLFSEGQQRFALSPDGRSVVTALAVSQIPAEWETLYPPPYPSSAYRVRAGQQELLTLQGSSLISQYVQIDLQAGSVRNLTNAPTSYLAGWSTNARPSWSADGRAVLLPGTFIDSEARAPSRPCIAILDVSSGGRSCLERMKAKTETGYEDGYRYISDIRFDRGHKDRVVVSFYKDEYRSQGTTEYRRTADGTWVVARETTVKSFSKVTNGHLELTVNEGLNDPPVLVATDLQTKVSRVMLDPNPQLKGIELGAASVYKWKDKTGRDWMGGLYKPTGYVSGRHYPLVIQTHGFVENLFRPSGIFPTAFAARALAAQGVMVLQVDDCKVTDTPDEAPCNVRGYEAGVNQLVAEGLVDSSRIGIVGFSRSCFYVMEALTASRLPLKAASITDGVMDGYIQYMMSVDGYGNGLADEYDALTGARPFGEGLQQWLERSPLFKMDKVTAALLVVGEGRPSLLGMLEPYAAMRYLHKPADLILLNTGEHVLTNPSARLASQGGTVDWFRFWLQDYEDPDPAKAEQYRRWERLCDMQIDQNPNHPAFCVRTKTH